MACKWADLPPELLSIIAGGLPHPIDRLRLRWICRSWRSSASPPPSILSPFLPLTGFSGCMTITAAAVYLLRPRSDPSQSWIVSLHEPVAGKLLLRHALTHAEFPMINNNSSFDLSSDDWISATRISRWFEWIIIPGSSDKVVFVPHSSSSPCELWWGARNVGLACFELDLSISLAIDKALEILYGPKLQFQDFVRFKGTVHVVDDEGNLFEFVHQQGSSSHMIERLVKCSNNPVVLGGKEKYKWIRLVVSDGELYVVLKYLERCRIYRLVHNKVWKEVEDLRRRVFFIAKNCSFSVWVRAPLPPPWEPNSIVCFSDDNDHGFEVFKLRGGNNIIMSSSGYSNLFAPPSSWIDNQAQREKSPSGSSHLS